MADQMIEWEMTVALLVAVKNEAISVRPELLRTGAQAAGHSHDNLVEIFYLQHKNVLVKILLTKTPDPCQGGDAAAWITTTIAQRYDPHCIVMVGMCAGDRKVLKLGDVVIATSTLRHDHGKLEKRSSPTRLTFHHRHEPIKIEEELTTQLRTYVLEHYEVQGTSDIKQEGEFKVAFGVIATGNQVTKVPGVFSYLKQQIVPSLLGDEHNRTLIGLEMEAYSVAYAAKNSRIPVWLVVKGVSDFADRHKHDEAQPSAIQNATLVTLDILKEVIAGRFVRSIEKDAIALEQKAQSAFLCGNIEEAKSAATQAHQLGRRSTLTRRRYLHSLTQFGEYDAAWKAIEDYRRTGTVALNDHVTTEVAATILWREGQYDGAQKLLSAERIKGHRQLLYLRAVNEVLRIESEDHCRGSVAGKTSVSHLKKARNLLDRAMRMQIGGAPPWWIMVNLYWVLRLLNASDEEQAAEFRRASESLHRTINESGKGAPRLYLLFLLATAGNRTEFDRQAEKMSRDISGIQVPLELMDTIYERLEILHRRGILADYQDYWTRICRWLRRARKIGRPVREATARLMK